MKNIIDQAREIVDSLFYNDSAITQWQWELLNDALDEKKERIRPSISDLSIIIQIMKDENEQAMRDKVRASTFAESQKPLKMKYPYPLDTISKLEKELVNRVNKIGKKEKPLSGPFNDPKVKKFFKEVVKQTKSF